MAIQNIYSIQNIWIDKLVVPSLNFEEENEQINKYI